MITRDHDAPMYNVSPHRVVHVPPEPMFAILTACYEAMWIARAKRVAA